MAILTREEIARSLTGAWYVFLDRPDAAQLFDVSVNGFWRSFRAIVLVAPAYALSAMVEREVILAGLVDAGNWSDQQFIVAKVLTLCLDWIALPLLLALVAGQLGVSRTYSAFVVARNWGAVLAIAPFGAIALLYLLGIFGEEATNIGSLVILVIILRYNYLIARRVLGLDTAFAIGLVVADFALSFSIAAFVDGLAGVSGQ